MFYSDRLGRLMPFILTVLGCLGFWAFAARQFPGWAFLILAVVSGVLIALTFGEVLNRRFRRQISDRELDETVRRKRIQDNLNQL